MPQTGSVRVLGGDLNPYVVLGMATQAEVSSAEDDQPDSESSGGGRDKPRWRSRFAASASKEESDRGDVSDEEACWGRICRWRWPGARRLRAEVMGNGDEVPIWGQSGIGRGGAPVGWRGRAELYIVGGLTARWAGEQLRGLVSDRVGRAAE